MPPAEIATMALAFIAIGGVIFHAGMLSERVSKLEQRHDELYRYAHALNHDVLDRINEHLAQLQIQILAITPRDQWPK